tara:strand:- start:181 stop:357 length:177 start_codon:yes stop_codon:yes gene_type:complete
MLPVLNLHYYLEAETLVEYFLILQMLKLYHFLLLQNHHQLHYLLVMQGILLFPRLPKL